MAEEEKEDGVHIEGKMRRGVGGARGNRREKRKAGGREHDGGKVLLKNQYEYERERT